MDADDDDGDGKQGGRCVPFADRPSVEVNITHNVKPLLAMDWP